MEPLRLAGLDERSLAPMKRSIRLTTGRDVDEERLRTRLAESGRWGDHGAEFGFWRGDHLAGVLQGMFCARWGDPGNVEVGILVFDPEERGRGTGREALTLWLDHLFLDRGAYRAWFLTSPDNHAMVRIGETCGFLAEGLQRGSVLDGDTLHDDLMFGITRDDPRPSLR